MTHAEIVAVLAADNTNNDTVDNLYMVADWLLIWAQASRILRAQGAEIDGKPHPQLAIKERAERALLRQFKGIRIDGAVKELETHADQKAKDDRTQQAESLQQFARENADRGDDADDGDEVTLGVCAGVGGDESGHSNPRRGSHQGGLVASIRAARARRRVEGDI